MRYFRTVLALPLLLVSVVANAQAPITITGKVTTSDGKPAVDVEVAPFWMLQGGGLLPVRAVKSGADGTFTLETAPIQRPTNLLAYTKDRSLSGMVRVTRDIQDKPVQIVLSAAHKLKIEIVSRELGRPLDSSSFYLQASPDAAAFLQGEGFGALHELPLPAGEYLVHGRASHDVREASTKATIKGGDGAARLDLPLTPIGRLKGKPAPDLTVSDARGVGKDVKLSDFRGKWLVLEFWGHW